MVIKFLEERLGQILVVNTFKTQEDETLNILDETFLTLKNFQIDGNTLTLNDGVIIKLEDDFNNIYVDPTFGTLFITDEYQTRGTYICKIVDMPNYYGG